MSSSSLKTWVLSLEFCSYDVCMLRCKYFRFIGRYFEFSMFACIPQYKEQVIQILNLDNIYLVGWNFTAALHTRGDVSISVCRPPSWISDFRLHYTI